MCNHYFCVKRFNFRVFRLIVRSIPVLIKIKFKVAPSANHIHRVRSFKVLFIDDYTVKNLITSGPKDRDLTHIQDRV